MAAILYDIETQCLCYREKAAPLARLAEGASIDFFRLCCLDLRSLNMVHMLLQQMNPTGLEGANGRIIFFLASETKVIIILDNALLSNSVDFADSRCTQNTVSLPGVFISAWDATVEW